MRTLTGCCNKRPCQWRGPARNARNHTRRSYESLEEQQPDVPVRLRDRRGNDVPAGSGAWPSSSRGAAREDGGHAGRDGEQGRRDRVERGQEGSWPGSGGEEGAMNERRFNYPLLLGGLGLG